MDTATLLKTETPALLVPRAGDDAAMKRIRESLPGLNPEFCYYDELEALLPLATFVAVRIRSRTLDVDLILEDPKCLLCFQEGPCCGGLMLFFPGDSIQQSTLPN